MTPLEIVLCIVINALWIVPLVYELIIVPVRDRRSYNDEHNKWKKENPNVNKKLCTKCKYCKLETHWQWFGGYYPERVPEYCRLLKCHISGKNMRCMLPAPPPELQESELDKIIPNCDTFTSAYGNCYHSTPNCKRLRSADKVYKNLPDPVLSLRPCNLCWKIENNSIVPK